MIDLQVIKDRVLQNNPEQGWIIDNLVFLHTAGSTLYGLNSESSDIDIRGITIAPKGFWAGARHFETFELKIPELNCEIVIHDIRKWANLALGGNPNIVETLFISNSEMILKGSLEWGFIKPIMLDLLNLQVHKGYSGYSHGQMKKMLVKQSNKTGRTEITEEFGFDLKFVMHAFRVTRQGAELLLTKNITFPRPDREDLLDIRFGRKYKPHEQDRCIEDLRVELQNLDAAYVDSELPEKADFFNYEQLLIYIMDNFVKA